MLPPGLALSPQQQHTGFSAFTGDQRCWDHESQTVTSYRALYLQGHWWASKDIICIPKFQKRLLQSYSWWPWTQFAVWTGLQFPSLLSLPSKQLTYKLMLPGPAWAWHSQHIRWIMDYWLRPFQVPPSSRTSGWSWALAIFPGTLVLSQRNMFF